MVGRAARTSQQAARLLPAYQHRVVCSTDSDEIARAAASWGAEVAFLRPAALATDDADSIDAALHASSWLAGIAGSAPDAVAVVRPTSPLASPEDLATAIRLHFETDGAPVVTVSPTRESPCSFRLEGARLALSSSEAPGRGEGLVQTVMPNGAVCVATSGFLQRERRPVVPGLSCGSLMPPDRSIEVTRESDLAVCDALLRGRAVPMIAVGKREIGPGHPCFMIAEAGVNHNGDPALAHRLVDAAAAAGADAVKFQTFDPARLAAARAPKAEYQDRALGTGEDQREMLARLVLPRAVHSELMAHAHEGGLEFLSSPFDEEAADYLRALGVPAFKVPSGELTNHHLLEHLAGFGLPLLMSTGMSTMAEVAQAVDAVLGAGAPPLALLHCVSNYPAEPASANLTAMSSLALAFGVPVGWSDHTPGIEIALAAAALGAGIIEKHLTLSRTLPGPDQASSLEEGEFAALVRGVRHVEQALGDGVKRPSAAELPIAAVARKSLHWNRDRDRGERIRPDDLIALRPGTGLSPARAGSLIGRCLKRDVRAGTVVRVEEVDPA